MKIFQDRFLTNFWTYEGLKGLKIDPRKCSLFFIGITIKKYYDNIKIGLQLENDQGDFDWGDFESIFELESYFNVIKVFFDTDSDKNNGWIFIYKYPTFVVYFLI